MSFLTLLRKELLEGWRTKRMLIVAAVLVAFGLGSPLLAKFTPEMLRSIPDLPAGLALLIPPPTLADAVLQYVKNMSQFGILLAVLMSMGSVAQEKERGTAVMILTRPVGRMSYLLAKFTALLLTFLGSLVLAALGCWYYTLLLFEPLLWMPFLGMNALMLVVFLVYMAVTLLASTAARTQSAAAGLAFAALVLIVGVGALPSLAKYFPGQLFSWGTALALNAGGDPAWQSLWISLLFIIVALFAAWLILRRQEL